MRCAFNISAAEAETAESILMQNILAQYIMNLASKGGFISPRETFAFETRVKRWVWRLMKDFNIKRQEVDRGNPTLDRLAAGFCKI